MPFTETTSPGSYSNDKVRRLLEALKQAISEYSASSNSSFIPPPDGLFTLILPEQCEVNNLEDLDIQGLRTIHIGKGKKIIFGILISKDAAFLSQNGLAYKLASKIADTLGIKQDEVNISWHYDCLTFTFVLSSRLAPILFYRHSIGELKKIIDFDVQDLRIGQYDWDNYLDPVPVIAG